MSFKDYHKDCDVEDCAVKGYTNDPDSSFKDYHKDCYVKDCTVKD